MAEAIALRDAPDLMESASAGLNPLGVIQKLTLQTIEANGYSTDGLYSKPILNDVWVGADLVINMSGYSCERVFARGDWRKVEDWAVNDPYGSDPGVYQRTFDDIRAKIEALATRLRSGRPNHT